MSRTVRLTDAGLRTALLPPPDLGAPAGLLGAISADVARTPQDRPRVRFPVLPGISGAAWVRHDPRLAWVALAALLLLALAAGALIAGAMLRGVPERQLGAQVPLVPTGVEVLATEAGPYDRVVVDGRGTYWAVGTGRVTRFDPQTGDRQTWTVADDVAFSGSAIAPARDGGVWISGGTRLLHFTGADLIDPFGVQFKYLVAFSEQPDGTLWALDWVDGPMRWDGRAWQALPAGRPTTRARVMTITTGGDVWVANLHASDTAAGVSRFSDGRWTTWDESDALPLGGSIGAIVEASDGSIWVTMDPGMSSTDPGIARFSGGTWTVIDGPGFPAWWLEAAPDGSIWAVTAEAGVARVARHLDGSWTTYDMTDGLVGTSLGHVSATPAGTFLGTDAGLFRFVDDRWVAAWSVAAGPGDSDPNVPPVPVSRDAAWVADGRGVWHYVDGRWAGPTLPDTFAGAWIHGLAVGPDEAVWIAGASGVAVLRSGTWAVVHEDPAYAMAIAPDGTVWVGGEAGRIVGLRASGSSFATQEVTCPMPMEVRSMAAAADGTLWVGSMGWHARTGLARFDGRSCTLEDVLGDGRMWDVTEVAAAPGGGIAVQLVETASEEGWTSRVARLDDTGWAVIERWDNVPGLAAVDLAFDPSGNLWRRSSESLGIEQFDGERWVTGPDGLVVGVAMAFAPDGSLWSTGPSGIERIPAERLAAD